jgi:hypothetical protein
MAFRRTALCAALVIATALFAPPAFAQPHLVKPNVHLHIIQPSVPVLQALEIPLGSGAFSTVGTPVAAGVYEVLPLAGTSPVVRVWLASPGSTLHIRATPLGGATTVIPAAPAGTTPSFQVLSVDRTKTPAQWHVQIAMPASFQNLHDYTIAISESLPQVAPLHQGAESLPTNVRLLVTPNYNVHVLVFGNATVVSGPPAINCSSGGAGTCDHSFKPGSVGVPNAPPGSFLTPVTVVFGASFGAGVKFLSWGAACASASSATQCILKIDGSTPTTVTATFSDPSGTGTVCPAPGPNFVDTPECTPQVGATFKAQCDASGYFCCEPQQGATSARCGGQGKHEFTPDCHQNQSLHLTMDGCDHS